VENTYIKNPHLDGHSFFLPGNSTGVLLLHGFTATTVEMQPLARSLNARGFTVAGPLLPGHGTRIEDINRCRWQDWSNYATEAYQSLKEKCSVVFVGGESMGGLISLFLASQFPEIAGVMLFAPALSIPGIRKAYLAAPFVRFTQKRYIHSQSEDFLPWQGYTVVPIRALIQVHKLQKEIRRRLPMIQQPVMICQGRKDTTIDPQSSQTVYDTIGSIQKDIYWFDQAGHCIVLDSVLDQIAQLSFNFIQKNTQENDSKSC